jgi:serine/threonine-protein kinase
VLDVGLGTPPYIVMELLEGESLRARLLRDGTLAQSRCVVVASQLLSALRKSHECGILHRDVKPANIFLVKSAAVGVSVKLLDFGIAKLAEPEPGQKPLTRPKHIVGSGAYMSPEQVLGQPLGPETDIYSVGVVLYEALAGAKPFVGDDPTLTLARIVEGTPPPPIAGVHPAFMKVILRALSRHRADRFASAEAMSRAIEPLVPRLSAMNIQSPLVVEDPTEPIVPSGARTERTGPPAAMVPAVIQPATLPMIQRGAEASLPSAALGATLPLSHVLPRASAAPSPPREHGAARPVIETEPVALPMQKSPARALFFVAALVGIGAAVVAVSLRGGPTAASTPLRTSNAAFRSPRAMVSSSEPTVAPVGSAPASSARPRRTQPAGSRPVGGRFD